MEKRADSGLKGSRAQGRGGEEGLTLQALDFELGMPAHSMDFPSRSSYTFLHSSEETSLTSVHMSSDGKFTVEWGRVGWSEAWASGSLGADGGQVWALDLELRKSCGAWYLERGKPLGLQGLEDKGAGGLDSGLPGMPHHQGWWWCPSQKRCTWCLASHSGRAG